MFPVFIWLEVLCMWVHRAALPAAALLFLRSCVHGVFASGLLPQPFRSPAPRCVPRFSLLVLPRSLLAGSLASVGKGAAVPASSSAPADNAGRTNGVVLYSALQLAMHFRPLPATFCGSSKGISVASLAVFFPPTWGNGAAIPAPSLLRLSPAPAVRPRPTRGIIAEVLASSPAMAANAGPTNGVVLYSVLQLAMHVRPLPSTVCGSTWSIGVASSAVIVIPT